MNSGRSVYTRRRRLCRVDTSTPGHMLIDGWMPAFGASERHEIRVGASARHTFDAITTADLAAGISSLGADGFRAPIPDGVARTIWNFAVQPLAEGGCHLSTETRVGWSDAAAGRSFRRYWRFVRPWSGLTRRHMLRSIRAEAERNSGR